MIRLANAQDAHRLAEIYNHYVLNTVVTFEEQEVSAEEMRDRLELNLSGGLPWLVAQDQSGIVGYAYASKWKGRCAYRFSVEVTVYLSQQMSSQGWGTKLYTRLFEELKKCSIHSVIGGIALPNDASIALHEKFGMQKVAHFKEVGFKFGQWVDVGYWQGELSDS